jgi:hypothetical protein
MTSANWLDSSFWEVLQTPRLHAAHLIIAALCAVICLLGIWAGRSRAHWFVRVGAVLVVLALFVPMRAYEPLLLFAITVCILVAGWRIAHSWSAASTRQKQTDLGTAKRNFQFSVRDLLLAMVVIGAIIWMASRIVDEGLWVRHWWNLPVAALLLAAVSSVAFALVGARRRWPSTLVLVALIGTAAAVDLWVLDNFMDTPWGTPQTFAVCTLDYAYLAILCLVMSSFLSAGGSSWQPSVKRNCARGLGVTFGLTLLVVFGTVYWQMLDLGVVIPQSPTGKNVYPRVLELGHELRRIMATPAPGEPVYSEGLFTNLYVTDPIGRKQAEPIYDALLPLLHERGFTVIDWKAAKHSGFDTFKVADAQFLRSFLRILHAEGDRLAAAGNYDRSADLALAEIELGKMRARNGISTQVLVGQALESIGDVKLSKLRRDVSASKRSDMLAILQRLEVEKEPQDDMVSRVEIHDQLVGKWRNRLEILIRSPRFTSRHYPLEHNRLSVGATSGLLMVDLALRCYREDHGGWPTDLTALVPEYLPSLPDDPYSERPFVYRAGTDDFVLYSVGFDGQDDGGKFADASAYNLARYRKETGLDYDLDVSTRYPGQ